MQQVALCFIPLLAAADGLEFVDLGQAATMDAVAGQVYFGLDVEFDNQQIAWDGLPFRVALEGPAWAAMAPEGAAEAEVRVALEGRASEIYILAAARLTGKEELVYTNAYGVEPPPLTHIHNVDRICITVRYGDGTEHRAVPAIVGSDRWGIGPGLQVLTVRADADRDLDELVLYKGTAQLEVGVAAVTLNRSSTRRFDARWQVKTAPAVADITFPLPENAPSAKLEGSRLLLANRYLEAEFDLNRAATLVRLIHHAISIESAPKDSLPLFGVKVDGQERPFSEFQLVAAKPIGVGEGYELIYAAVDPAVEVALTLHIGEEPSLGFRMAVRNAGTVPMTVEPIGPRFSGLAVGEAAAMWYLIPAAETILSDEMGDYAKWYGGSFMPMQFMDAYNPQAGGGISLLIKDLELLEKRYDLVKQPAGIMMLILYQPRILDSLEVYTLAPAELHVHTGDWKEAFAHYMDWVRTWYRPGAENAQWWREVFNLRQGFLHIEHFGTIVDPETKTYRFDTFLDEVDEIFGGAEYLHVFDWGIAGPYGRTYGRVGDPDPGAHYDEGPSLPGGWEGFAEAIEGVRERGLHVGYYTEGYLLDDRGPIGRRHGQEWVQRQPGGEEVRWPNSSEIGLCPGVLPWRDVQAESYARFVQRMDADGMYIDQFSLNGPIRWCYSPDHGHRVPSNALKHEAEMTLQIRRAVDAVKTGVMIYTEYTPTDVISQYQNGAFSYSMQRQQNSPSIAPLKLFRYAFPTFKNFEILRCDGPTGTFAEGVRWTFWNGEGIWLEGKPREWFAPQTQGTIRACHRVLIAHKDAFAGVEAETLAPTCAAGIYANRFVGEREIAYTFYNARRETFSGPVIELPEQDGVVYVDAFADKTIAPVKSGNTVRLALTLDPHGVGCIVVAQDRSG